MMPQPNRNLVNGKQFIFKSVKQEDPEFWEALKISQTNPKLVQGSKAKMENQNELSNQKLVEFENSISELQGITKSIQDLQITLKSAKSANSKGATELDEKVRQVMD